MEYLECKFSELRQEEDVVVSWTPKMFVRGIILSILGH